MENQEWLLCPNCRNKTRIKIREDTILSHFPLFCPKCRQENLINARRLKISVIKEPDAEPIIRYIHAPSAVYFLMGTALFFGIYTVYFMVTYIGFKRNAVRELLVS